MPPIHDTTATSTTRTRWTSVQAAADHLGLSAGALRKLIERNAVRAADGGVEAHVDGLRARKLGRLWRVALSPAWSGPAGSVAAPARRSVGSARRESAGNDREGSSA